MCEHRFYVAPRQMIIIDRQLCLPSKGSTEGWIARQHRELFYTVLLPYTIGFLLVAVMPNVFAEMYKAQNSGFYVTQPEISLIRVGLIFLSLLFIDVVLHWAFVSYLKKHSVGALKGEF